MAVYPPQFLGCLPFTLAQECPDPGNWPDPANFSDTPGDPGGATMDGVIQEEFTDYLMQNDLPNTSVINIAQDQGYAIYYGNYWIPYCQLCQVGLDLSLFDSNVNEGVGEGIRILQVALGVTNDGLWGPQTAGALAGVSDVSSVIKLFTARRIAVYHETSGFAEFGADWVRRATEIGADALAMASGTVVAKLAPRVFKRVPRAKFFLRAA